MSDWSEEIDVDVPEEASEVEVERLQDEAIDRKVNARIDSDIDDLLKGL